MGISQFQKSARPPRALGRLLLAGMLALTCPSWAQEGSAGDSHSLGKTKVEFLYQAPEGCPSKKEAFSLVLRHTHVIELADAGEDAPLRLSLRVVKLVDGHEGLLSVQRGTGGQEERSVNGDSCEEVVGALALTAALSLDPDASLIAREAEASPLDESKSEELPPSQSKKESPSSNQETAPSSPLIWSLGVVVGVEALMDYSAHLGMGVTWAVRRDSSRKIFPLELQASLRYLSDAPFRNTEEDPVSSSIALAQFSYCALRLGKSPALLLCPSVELGLLSASGDGLEDSSQSARFYAAVGLEAPLRLALSGKFEILAIPAIHFPLTRRQFAVDPGAVVAAETRRLSFRGSVAIRYIF